MENPEAAPEVSAGAGVPQEKSGGGTEEAPSAPEPTTRIVTFGEGTLGFSLGEDRSIGRVVGGSQAEVKGVQVGDALVRIGEAEVVAMHYNDILNMIKTSTRPVDITFIRPPPASNGTPSKAGMPKVALPSADQAKAAVKKAGQFMKGLLNTSVQIVQAVDKGINKAIDDSAKQVASAARATVRDLSHSGKRASMKIKNFDVRGKKEADPLPPEAVHLADFAAQQRGAVQTIQSNNAEIQQLVDAVDTAVTRTAAHMQAYLEESKALDKTLSVQLPELALMTKALSARTGNLKELMTAIEGKMTSLAVAKLDRQHQRWLADQQKGVEQYRLEKARKLLQMEQRIREDEMVKAAAQTLATAAVPASVETKSEVPAAEQNDPSTPSGTTAPEQSPNSDVSALPALPAVPSTESVPQQESPRDSSSTGKVKEIAKKFETLASPTSSSASKASKAFAGAGTVEETVAPVDASATTSDRTPPDTEGAPEEPAGTGEPKEPMDSPKEKKKGKGKKNKN